MDTLDAADFFGKAKLATLNWQTSPVWQNNARDVYPNWVATFTITYDTTAPSKPLYIELWDKDLFSNDRADISWRSGINSLDLVLNLNDGTWSGDDGFAGDYVGWSNGEADGQGGDWDDCSIGFWITVT